MEGLGLEKKRLMKEAESISVKLDVFAFHYDWYGYMDDVDDRETAVMRQKKKIVSGDTVNIKRWLLDAIAEHDENENEVISLLDELENFEIANAYTIFSRKNYLKNVEDSVEQNDNNFDGIINNVSVETKPEKKDEVVCHGKQRQETDYSADR